MKSKNLFSLFIFVIILVLGILWSRAVYDIANVAESAIIVGSSFVVALTISTAIKIADP